MMKKILLALCAVSMLTMFSCKDKPEDNPGGGGNTPQQEEDTSGDGYFMPSVRISHILFSDDTPPELWVWEDQLLASIDESDNCGGSTPVSTFTYNGLRLSQMNSTIMDVPMTVDYTYNGKLLKSITASSSGMPMLQASFNRNNDNKISSADLQLNDIMVQMLLQSLLQQLGQGGDDNGDDEGGETMALMLKHCKGNKFSLQSTDFDLHIDWTGDNATRVLLAGTVNFTITVEEARNLMNYDTSMATYSAMLGMLGNNTELPVALTIADTITYTYDNNPSPYLGFLGSLDITILSANNVENSANHGSLNADITIPLSSVISFMSDQHIPFGYTLPERITSNSYTYYSNGYPQTVTDQDNNTKEIFYVE